MKPDLAVLTALAANTPDSSIVKEAADCLERGENERALYLFELALSHSPQNHDLEYCIALTLAGLDRTRDARARLASLLFRCPTHRLAKELMDTLQKGASTVVAGTVDLTPVETLLACDKGAEALREIERIIAAASTVPGVHYLHARCLNAVGRHEEALVAARKELDCNPGHAEARKIVDHLSVALAPRKSPMIPTAARPWNTTIPQELLHSIQNATHSYTYRGITMIKNPFDFAIYPLIIWDLKPRTIIEIGSKAGGSALWMGDMLENFGIDGRVISVDIVKVTSVSHPRVTFLEGNGRNPTSIFTPELLRSLSRPWLVIEDADHTRLTSIAILDFFHQYLAQNDYIIIEDGIISDLQKDATYNSGPHAALKEFLAKHGGEYEVDGRYCDFFGYNVTWCTNGILRRVKAPIGADAVSDARRAIDAGKYAEALKVLADIKATRVPTRHVDFLRALCFRRMGRDGDALAAVREELRFFADNHEARALLSLLESNAVVEAKIGDEEFRRLYRIVRPYSMLSEERLHSLYLLAKKICLTNVPGNIVECGVAAGGSTALLAAVTKKYSAIPRMVYAFDSFEGLPVPCDKDRHEGAFAESCGWGAGTCAAPLESLLAVCTKVGAADLVKPIKGFFLDMLPRHRDAVRPVALLHIDCDWYDSTAAVLHNLYDTVPDAGFVQIDDYGYWEGCKLAVEEFAASRGLKFTMHQIDATGVYFQKGI